MAVKSADLENDGHERVHRHRAANLGVRKRKKGKRPVSERVPLQLASTVDEVWSMGFVSGSPGTGRRVIAWAARAHGFPIRPRCAADGCRKAEDG